jgi:hypothetical protein
VLVADDPAEEAAELEAQDGVVIDAEPDVVPPKRERA